MGSSRGAKIVRAHKSASRRKMAPPNREAGKSRLWFGPVKGRTRCGVMSPTKLMLPPMETHTPIKMLTQMSTRRRTARTLTPMERAFSSPMEKAFNSSAVKRRMPPQTSRQMASAAALG